jgi:hypothetical protein
MQYLILIYGDEAAYTKMTEADMNAEHMAYMEYSKEFGASGLLKGGASLKPIATATTVRVKGGKATTTDGPFAETKEQLGGYYLIDAPSLDEAIKWAGKCPGAAHGCCEVRPLGIICGSDGAVTAMQ